MGTITKALEMLNFFSREKPEIGLGEFVRLTGRDKATVHRHLGELEENGFLEQLPVSRAYRLGPAILRLAAVRETTHPARRLLRPIVSQLADDIGELVHVSLLQGAQLSPVFHADPKCYGTQVHFDVAEMLPLHATSSGQAVLAFAAPELCERVLGGPLPRYTDETTTDRESLLAMVERARETGIGKAERTFDEEVTSESIALFDAAGQPVGALAVIVPAVRASEEKWSQIRPLLIDAARAATHSLGGVLPPSHPLK
ncbi:IclR family transcriptional regulator [Tropicibacter sp. S64]|uniref:IclR family transcriptional regulator n=1 Tax=Tropicibacter sp. S64 TaxID=3415122 RepID=UPI003C7E4100